MSNILNYLDFVRKLTVFEIEKCLREDTNKNARKCYRAMPQTLIKPQLIKTDFYSCVLFRYSYIGIHVWSSAFAMFKLHVVQKLQNATFVMQLTDEVQPPFPILLL